MEVKCPECGATAEVFGTGNPPAEWSLGMRGDFPVKCTESVRRDPDGFECPHLDGAVAGAIDEGRARA